MAGQSKIFFMESPPKTGAAATIARASAKRTGAAARLQQFLNNPKCKQKKVAPKPKPGFTTARVTVTFKETKLADG